MKKYKLSAFLIALCMLVSIVPAIPAAQAAEADQVIALVSPTEKILITAVNIEESGWEINQEKTHTDVLGRMKSDTNFTYSFANTNQSKFGYSHVGEYAAIDFKVNEDGYYNIDLIINANASYTAEVSTTIDGVAMNNVAWPNETTQGITKTLGSKFLTKGVHTLVMKCVSTPKVVFFQSINLTRTDAPQAEAGVTEQTVYFNTASVGGAAGLYKDMSIPNNGWEMDEATTTPSLYTQLSTLTSYTGTQHSLNGGCSKIQLFSGATVGLAFVVDATGYYDLSANILTGDDTGVYASADAAIDDISVGSVDCYVATGSGYVDVKLKDRVYLEAGRHVLKLHRTSSSSDRLYIASLTLAASDVQEAAEKTPFGYRYALVRNSTANGDTTYSLYVVSGISDTNYKNAGFELKIGNGTKTMTTQNVYTSFTFTNDKYANGSGVKRTTAIAPVDFALDSGYIYYVEFKLSEDEVNSAMDITAFVTDANDNQIKGETVTVAAK